MKVTREQMEKWNSKMSNGWQFNLYAAMMRNEKECVKEVKIGECRDGNAVNVRCTLMFHENRQGKFPCLHLAIYRDIGNGMCRSDGLGKFIKLGENVTRANFSQLQKETANFSDKTLMEYAEQYGLMKQASLYIGGKDKEAMEQYGGIF